MVIGYADRRVLGLSSGGIRGELGLSAEQFGSVASSYYLLGAVSAVLIGFLATRIRSSLMLGLLVGVWTLAQLPLAFPTTFTVLIGTRIVLGIAEGPANPLSNHELHHWFHGHDRMLPTVLMHGGSNICGLAVAPALAWAIGTWSWHTAFAILAGIGVLWLLLWSLSGKGNHGAARPVRTEAAPIPYRKLLLSSEALAVFVTGFAAYWALALSLAWVPSYLATLGYPQVKGGLIAGAPQATTGVLAIAIGWLAQRRVRRGGSRWAARSAPMAIVLAISGICLFLVPHAERGGLLIVLVSLGLGCSQPVTSLVAVHVSELVPVGQRPAVLTLAFSVPNALAGMCAPAVTGFLVSHASDPATGYGYGFMLAGVLSVAGAVAALWIGRSRLARAVLPRRGFDCRA
ncbi:MFS transporter [Sciscionella sediminilitoris]|uniref:MFS transporter n=1 Tax=Sciscionella sediminilitoris TaxID=1445613 RepID=UPI0004DF5ACE|nr:MFS transporter [Sciscionella sp. SE31]